MSAAVESVVRERLGLDPTSLGPDALGKAVEGRMSARGLSDPAVYAARLITEAAERDALACELAVSETWFFRGGRPLFDRLGAFVAERAAAAPARVLSAPCSTGEEPYSLAISLYERFLTPNQFAIDAVDLSERALAKAAAARYGPFAFREAGGDVRPAYFRAADDGWELLPHLRGAVRLLPGNLTDPAFLAGEKPYDLILCRNLFIYLTPDAKLRAMANIDRLLALDGRLCVTPAEADRLPAGRFVLDGPPEFGVYRRVGVGSGLHKILAPEKAAPISPEVTPPPKSLPAPARPAPETAAAPGTLDAARQLADAGRLADARGAIESILRARPTDADALALLGVVHLAAGREDLAFDALRKALYLAPGHLEAMSHMAGLCEKRGDAGRAAALRRRLARAAREDA
jgi:chemotaxis protein methyltransferase WspC